VISEPDSGIYHAMNKGINSAKGDYLIFINSGDELIDPKIIEQVTPLISDEDFVFCNLVIASNHSDEIKQYPNQLSFKYFLTESLPHPATFIKRVLFQVTGGYDERYKICSDWAFFIIMICKHQATYKYIPLVLSKFYLDGISSAKDNRELIARERKQVIDEHFNMYSDLIKEWEENQKLRIIFENSRLIKVARKLGFLKPLSG
jgi:glycosyltransferase involved in cell wall biosynthesis